MGTKRLTDEELVEQLEVIADMMHHWSKTRDSLSGAMRSLLSSSWCDDLEKRAKTMERLAAAVEQAIERIEDE